MLILFLSPETIKPFFPNDYYSRGVAYHKEGRVHDVDVELENDSQSIIACVEGGGGNHYQVEVMLTKKSNKLQIDGECTCPVGFNCKHVVATLLTVIDDREFLIDEEELFHQLPVPSQQDPQIESWLKDLKAIIKENKKPDDKVDESYHLRYIFSSSGSYKKK